MSKLRMLILSPTNLEEMQRPPAERTCWKFPAGRQWLDAGHTYEWIPLERYCRPETGPPGPVDFDDLERRAVEDVRELGGCFDLVLGVNGLAIPLAHRVGRCLKIPNVSFKWADENSFSDPENLDPLIKSVFTTPAAGLIHAHNGDILYEIAERYCVVDNRYFFPTYVNKRFHPLKVRRKSRPILITTSRLEPYKQIERVLDMLATLGRQDVRLWIVGGGSHASFLKSYARGLRVAHLTEFKGHVPPGDVLSLLCQAHIYCSVKDETNGNFSLVEAMTAEACCFVLDERRIRDFVAEDRGVLVKRQELLTRFPREVCRLLDDYAEQRRLGRAARKFCLEGLPSEEEVAQDIVSFVEDVTAGLRPRLRSRPFRPSFLCASARGGFPGTRGSVTSGLGAPSPRRPRKVARTGTILLHLLPPAVGPGITRRSDVGRSQAPAFRGRRLLEAFVSGSQFPLCISLSPVLLESFINTFGAAEPAESPAVYTLSTPEAGVARATNPVLSDIVNVHHAGRLELVGSPATFTSLALLHRTGARLSLQSQVDVGVRLYSQLFGLAPEGFFLPCSRYSPGMEQFLEGRGMNYVVFGGDSDVTEALEPNPMTCAGSGLACFSAPTCTCATFPQFLGEIEQLSFRRAVTFDRPTHLSIAFIVHSETCDQEGVAALLRAVERLSDRLGLILTTFRQAREAYPQEPTDLALLRRRTSLLTERSSRIMGLTLDFERVLQDTFEWLSSEAPTRANPKGGGAELPLPPKQLSELLTYGVRQLLALQDGCGCVDSAEAEDGASEQEACLRALLALLRDRRLWPSRAPGILKELRSRALPFAGVVSVDIGSLLTAPEREPQPDETSGRPPKSRTEQAIVF